MIVFAGFTPHTPLLLPTVLAAGLEQSQPETMVLFSSHQVKRENAFSINLQSQYQLDMHEVGDITTDKKYYPDLQLIDTVQRGMRKKNINLFLQSDAQLDHSCGVPLLALTEKIKDIRVVPISSCELNAQTHLDFGNAIKDFLVDSDKRIAVIASGDLSHALTPDAPLGFRPEGKLFDAAVKTAVENKDPSILISLDEKLVEAAAECGYRPLLMLMGVLQRINVQTEVISYDAPFGVGHLVARFKIV